MKRIIGSLCFIGIAFSAVGQISEKDFADPPRDARPSTYWE